jgi:hypothetical protein
MLPYCKKATHNTLADRAVPAGILTAHNLFLNLKVSDTFFDSIT